MGIKFYFAFFFICISFSVYSSVKKILAHEKKREIQEFTYQSLLINHFLPFGFLFGIIFTIISEGIENAFVECLFMCINLIVPITLYYMVMLVILKMLRKKLHPLMISSLWTIPNFLYFFVLYNYKFLVENSIILTVNKKTAFMFFEIWMIGFVVVMCFKVIEHFQYRKQILNGAVEITDENILTIYQFEIERIKINRPKFTLMQSKNVTTPLTIGLKHKVILLPIKYYTDDEYHLIFRHEFIHVVRSDILTKLLLMFANALCWFNPFMWLATKKCSEDLELSCDISVVSDEDESVKKKYANLILKTASCEKGFTTCLSAGAKVLQYRLHNIMKIPNKSLGFFVVCLLSLIVSFSWGKVGIAIQGYNGYETLFHSKDVILSEEVLPMMYYKFYVVKDDAKIVEYLSNLELSKTSASIINNSKNSLRLKIKEDSNEFGMVLYNSAIKCRNQYYYVEEGIDWEYINQYIRVYPNLTISLLQSGVDLGENINPIIKKIESNDATIYESQLDSNYFSTNCSPSHLVLEVKENIVSYIEVKEETKDGISIYNISKDSEYIIETPKQDVEYEIKISYEIDGQIYNITYFCDFTYSEGVSLDEIILDKNK